MTFFGETIRKAREAKGLTTSQVADRTRILVQTIEAMEREDFKRIPAAIYGRGFVRHIAEVLEIDPKPLVAEFMEIYEGRKPPASAIPAPFNVQPPPSEQLSVPSEHPTAAPMQQPVASEHPAAAPMQQSVASKQPTVTQTQPPATVEEPSFFSQPDTQPSDLPPTNISSVDEVDAPSPSQNTASTNSDISNPAQPSSTTSQPEVVKGLDLFDPPPPTVQRTSTARTLWTGNDVQPVIDEDKTPSAAQELYQEQIPPATRAQDIFSSAYEEPNEDVPNGPSAADKFRESLSVVSHGVIGSVRSIPRSAWRIAILVIGAVAVIGLIIWGCKVLYRITEQPSTPSTPSSQTTSSTTHTTPGRAAASTVNTATPHAPGRLPPLRSTGQKIPPLYVD